MNVNDYLGKSYPSPPCWGLVADIYATELGQGVAGVQTVNGSIRQIAEAFRLHLHKSAHGFAQVATPQDYAVVLMGRSARLGLHHCGVAWQGKVLHALDSGIYWQDLASLQAEYTLMEFWAK